MIIGLGTDIISLERMKGLVVTDATNNRVFRVEEFDYCQSKYFPLQHFAGCWAAKEAYRKASGNFDIGMNEIEICHTDEGKPYFKFYNNKAHSIPLIKHHLSISHDAEYAVATVIIERL